MSAQTLPTSVVEKMVHKGLDERARTRIVFTGPISPTLENEVLLDVLENVLDIRVIDELRQTLGGTYSPQAATRWEMLPKPTYRAIIDFVSDPKRVEELTRRCSSVLEEPPNEGTVGDRCEQGQGAGAPRAPEGAWRRIASGSRSLQDHLTTPGDDGSDILRYEKRWLRSRPRTFSRPRKHTSRPTATSKLCCILRSSTKKPANSQPPPSRPDRTASGRDDQHIVGRPPNRLHGTST